MTVQNGSKISSHVLNTGHHTDLHDPVNTLSFGKRLREERERIGKSQAEFAEAGGVARTTQHIYESGIRSPDVGYLERVRGIGVDVSYLVLGARQAPVNSDTLTISYAALLNIYRMVDEFCVDGDGTPLPLEVRTRFFQLLCVSLRDKNGQDPGLETLRNELRKLTGT